MIVPFKASGVARPLSENKKDSELFAFHHGNGRSADRGDAPMPDLEATDPSLVEPGA